MLFVPTCTSLHHWNLATHKSTDIDTAEVDSTLGMFSPVIAAVVTVTLLGALNVVRAQSNLPPLVRVQNMRVFKDSC